MSKQFSPLSSKFPVPVQGVDNNSTPWLRCDSAKEAAAR
ncbi:hypothetical protein SAMN05518847_11068 [Paenibacillus sp. OV219]|nr:hypothetical protein SAMN05518847_11068 [Paenibacillus sp. OV219]